MCSIVILEPGQMLNREHFDNMCYNNWHSYGLVTIVNGRLDIKRCVPESGEIDPQELWDLVEKDLDYQRIIHVRHNTAGKTDLDNCHPFDVLWSKKRQVVFAHNGTMSLWKSKKEVEVWKLGNKVTELVDDDSGPSDSKNYVDKFLRPLLTSMDEGEGHGYYQSPLARTILYQTWPLNNRGIIISNDQKPLLLGNWDKFKGYDKDGQEVEIKVSNTDYFNMVKRGPEYTRRQERQKKEELKQVSTGKAIVPLAAIDFNETSFDLGESAKNILDDPEIWERDSAVNVAFLTQEELEEIYSDKNTCLNLMNWIFCDYHSMHMDQEALEDLYDELSGKFERQQNHINKIYAELARRGIKLFDEEEQKEAA